MPTLLIRFLLFVIAATHLSSNGQSANQIEYFGYYYFSASDSNGLVVSSVPRDLSATEANVAQTLANDYQTMIVNRAKGIKSMPAHVMNDYLYNDAAPCQMKSDLTNYYTWRSDIRAQLSSNVAHYVAAFYLADEPYHWLLGKGCSTTQIATFLNSGCTTTESRLPGDSNCSGRVAELRDSSPRRVSGSVGLDRIQLLTGSEWCWCKLRRGKRKSDDRHS